MPRVSPIASFLTVEIGCLFQECRTSKADRPAALRSHRGFDGLCRGGEAIIQRDIRRTSAVAGSVSKIVVVSDADEFWYGTSKAVGKTHVGVNQSTTRTNLTNVGAGRHSREVHGEDDMLYGRPPDLQVAHTADVSVARRR